ncbi:hypothetical protein BGW38_003762 [Lunasporangiospora selenospora]|uniref:Uncharacterized protein n=1 Tax=Lunasporangiospora selenospora TaxID=979761 RepID=A0A9P6G174_9FUNG|nr:hypothetical protein BGW38_003762 [Lunasporangiospora selenospora]
MEVNSVELRILAYVGLLRPTTSDDLLGKLRFHKPTEHCQDWQRCIDTKKEASPKTGSFVVWDGPSTFKTDAQNFKFSVGGGKLSGLVEVKQESIHQVELRIMGIIFYDEAKNAIPAQKDSCVVNKDFVHRGLRIATRETSTSFDAAFYLEEEGDDGSGINTPVSAALQFAIVFPDHYDSYKSLTIETNPSPGQTLDIQIMEKLDIEFSTLSLMAMGGSVQVMEAVSTENLVTYSFLRTFIQRVNAVTGKRITISSRADGDLLKLNVLTAHVRSSETRLNRLSLDSKSGNVVLTVLSDTDSKVDSSNKHTGFDLSVNTVSGLIFTEIMLADESQVLLINATSDTGSVRAAITDNYSGSLGLSSKFEVVEVLPKEGSTSEIVLADLA